MDLNDASSREDLWTPYKELVSVVESYLARAGSAPYAVQTFESLLRRHKQTFLALMKNPPKNVTHREEIKRGVSEGVTLPSVGRTVLSKELVDEAIIISDMYEVNEYLALELLLTAQRQAPRHPGLPRGLVAVLLYYDGRRCALQALRELVTAREGVCWRIDARPELVSYVTRYAQQLIDEGLLERALETLASLDLAAELQLLQSNRALGPPRHRRAVRENFHAVRKLLAGVLFAASAQRGLNRDTLMRLMSEVTRAPNPAGEAASGSLDDISLALHMALLYALDLSVLHRREDGEELVKKLPLIQDPGLIPALLSELAPSPGQPASGARALCQLSLGLALAALKRAPQSLLRRAGHLAGELLDQDEALVDAAIDGKVLEYLDEVVLTSERLHKEEYYLRRAHGLLTDFIVLMHSKLMDLRLKADEAARTAQMYAAEGLAPPAGDSSHHRGHFDALLRCVERLYQHDPLGLKAEYWVAVDQQHSHSYRSGGRSATLYKFVRLSGELVAPPLLPPYLRALASLAQPRHTWALLARRDAAPAAHQHSQPAPVSAHHLFPAMYRYYCNLRQDPVPISDQHMSSMGASALVTPGRRLLVRQDEVEALIAALKLIQAIASVDANACVDICENLQWDAVNCMFGLISCHVPVALKAQLALALAALGSCAASAPRVWAALEAAQLVRTVPSTAVYRHHGIHAELEEVETRNEEYPLTRAFLTLLDSLCAAGPLPRALGAGARAPGLDPYVAYVVQKVALPAPHRPYAKPAEKWQVLALCTKLLARWLEPYEPAPSDFPPAGRASDADPAPPPGWSVLLQLHTRSELLRLLLATLDETVAPLDTCRPQPGEEHMESCLVNVLGLLERALQLERQFIAEASAAGFTVIIMGLSKLILAPEGRDGTDRLVSVCRVLGDGARLPAAAARAVALLGRALQHPPAARHLLADLARDHATNVHIRHGFVECLEAEEWSSDAETASLVRQTKEGIVQLLQQTLHTPAPNVAHYLLGFQLSSDVSRSVLKEPGAAGYPRTVLHSLLDLLDAHIAGGENTDRQASPLVESAYRLLYSLCSPPTAAPTLRFLRARDSMLSRHVKAHVNLENASPTTLSARSWLLRACACEAAAAAAARQHSALAAMLTTLTATAHHPTQEWEWCALRRLLEGLAVSVEAAPEPRWELFHAAQLRRAIASCEQATGAGGKRVNVSRLHTLLVQELSSLQATAPQRTLVAAEIEKVLDYVTEVNRTRNLAVTLSHYYDSWRQLAEILFCVAPPDILDLEARKNLLLNILQDLLNKIPPAEVLPQLGNLASGTVLLLMVNLRHCYVTQKRNTENPSEFEFFGPSAHQTKSLSLKFILHKILSWLLVSGVSTQKMRINLYGALLNFLSIVNLKSGPADGGAEDVNSTYVSRLDSSKAKESKEESSLQNMVIDVISGFGESLCTVVCSDCVGGSHDVCRMAALSCLDALVEVRPHTDWTSALTDRGYLRNLIDSLLQDDEGLRQVLEPSPKSMRVLYVYESKMTLLSKIASTRAGAETVLEQGALACLAGLRALDCHPDVHAAARARDHTDFVPSVACRYRQILLPALSLCDALLTSLGTQNHSCIIHVTHFLLSHMETVDTVLRAAHPNSPPGLLTELEALTSVIARASNREVFGHVESDTALQGSAVSLYRVQCLVLALLPRFAGGGAALAARADDDDEPQVYYKIVSNLVTYARNILDGGGGGARVIFRPALSAAPAAYSAAPDNTPHMGAIVQMLQVMVERCHAQSKLLATLHNQLHNLPTMILDDVKKLLSTGATGAAVERSPLEARQAAQEALARRAATRRRELAHCCYSVEGALHLVWTHLHFYLRRALEPYALQRELELSPAGALQASCAGELADLRKGLVSVFNDKFTEELLDTAHGQPPSQRGLLDILVRDIKSMIQFAPL